MATTCRKKVLHLIVDSGALIKYAPLHEIAESIYTLEDVIAEIKDKATRQKLKSLPYELKFREPPSEMIKLVTEFSKKTGDYPSLSATDIRLLALTLLIEKEIVGIDHINTEKPINQAIINPVMPNNCKLPAGFYLPREEQSENFEDKVKEENIPKYSVENSHESETSDKGNDALSSIQGKLNGITELKDNDSVNDNLPDNPEEFNTNNCLEDEDEKWITPQNIEAVNKKIEELMLSDGPVPVACVTTDFAMQNVLLQMGLKLMSVDGMQIHRTKTFILRCHACFKTTSVMTKKFCPYCGNQTLKRVSVCINDDGTKSIHINFKKPINIRGTRYSLPMPKGGKHADNPILCEDQPLPQQRSSYLAQKKIDVFDPNYIINPSPFAINDVYSRAAHLGIRNQSSHKYRKNPNEKRRPRKKR